MMSSGVMAFAIFAAVAHGSETPWSDTPNLGCFRPESCDAGFNQLNVNEFGCGPDEAISVNSAHCCAPYQVSGHVSPGYTHDNGVKNGVTFDNGGNGFSFGTSYYVRVGRYLNTIPGHTSSQSGIFGQWIQDHNADRPDTQGFASNQATPLPWNSIEGGLFSHDKLGRKRYPVYMIGASTHMYNPNSDVSGGWGFFERAIGCEFLSRVQLSNTVIVPPNHLAFDETQEETDTAVSEHQGNFIGTSWAALPILGGKTRTDSENGANGNEHPNYGMDQGDLSWTFVVDTEQFKGPLVTYTPEHFYRAHDYFNALEDEIYWHEEGGDGNVNNLNGCCGDLCSPQAYEEDRRLEESSCADWCTVEYESSSWFKEATGTQNGWLQGCNDPACHACTFCPETQRQVVSSRRKLVGATKYFTKNHGKPLFFTQWADPTTPESELPAGDAYLAQALAAAKLEAGIITEREHQKAHRSLRSDESDIDARRKLGTMSAGGHTYTGAWVDYYQPSGYVSQRYDHPCIDECARWEDSMPFADGTCPTQSACFLGFGPGLEWGECVQGEIGPTGNPMECNEKVPGFDCLTVEGEPMLSLGKAPAKGQTSFGGELLAMPVFHHQTDDYDYVKIPQFIFPNISTRSAQVFDARQINTESLYNKYIDLFNGDLDDAAFDAFDATFYGNSRAQPHFGQGDFTFHVSPTSCANSIVTPLLNTEVDTPHLHITPWIDTETNSQGETDTYYNWDQYTGTGPREMGRYFKRGNNADEFHEVTDESEVPAELVAQEHIEQQYGQNYQAHNGRRQQDWCYDCDPNEPEKCDATIHKHVMQDGAMLRYRWYKFRHQPTLQQYAREYPEKYTEHFLDNLQSTWEKIHEKWGSGTEDQFLKRPTDRGNYNIVRFDPTMIVTPPLGKEYGWVPIVLELKQNDYDYAKGVWMTYNKYGNPLYLPDYGTPGHGLDNNNYDMSQWLDGGVDSDGNWLMDGETWPYGHQDTNDRDDDWYLGAQGASATMYTDYSTGNYPVDLPTGDFDPSSAGRCDDTKLWGLWFEPYAGKGFTGAPILGYALEKCSKRCEADVDCNFFTVWSNDWCEGFNTCASVTTDVLASTLTYQRSQVRTDTNSPTQAPTTPVLAAGPVGWLASIKAKNSYCSDGTDLWDYNGQMSVTTVEGCEAKAAATPGCIAFSWFPDEGAGWTYCMGYSSCVNTLLMEGTSILSYIKTSAWFEIDWNSHLEESACIPGENDCSPPMAAWDHCTTASLWSDDTSTTRDECAAQCDAHPECNYISWWAPTAYDPAAQTWGPNRVDRADSYCTGHSTCDTYENDGNKVLTAYRSPEPAYTWMRSNQGSGGIGASNNFPVLEQPNMYCADATDQSDYVWGYTDQYHDGQVIHNEIQCAAKCISEPTCVAYSWFSNFPFCAGYNTCTTGASYDGQTIISKIHAERIGAPVPLSASGNANVGGEASGGVAMGRACYSIPDAPINHHCNDGTDVWAWGDQTQITTFEECQALCDDNRDDANTGCIAFSWNPGFMSGGQMLTFCMGYASCLTTAVQLDDDGAENVYATMVYGHDGCTPDPLLTGDKRSAVYDTSDEYCSSSNPIISTNVLVVNECEALAGYPRVQFYSYWADGHCEIYTDCDSTTATHDNTGLMVTYQATFQTRGSSDGATPTPAPIDGAMPTDEPTPAPTDGAMPTDQPTADPTAEPTKAPTAPTGAPTDGAMPTDEPTSAPTDGAMPTDEPTKAPTMAATNPPLPEYVESDFAYIFDAEVVDLSTVDVSLSPTDAPTPPPTAEGYTAVDVQVEVAVVSTDLSFPLTVEEASNPVMQASLAAGMASSIGLDADAVSVTHVNGVAVSNRRLGGARQLNEEAAITFEIESASSEPEQVAALITSVTTAATQGSVVANVQAAAAANGVLVAGLKEMPRELDAPVIEESTKTVTVTIVELVQPPCFEDAYRAQLLVCKSYHVSCKAELQTTQSPSERKEVLCHCVNSASTECDHTSQCALGWSCINDALINSGCAAKVEQLNPQLASLQQICLFNSVEAIREDSCLAETVVEAEQVSCD